MNRKIVAAKLIALRGDKSRKEVAQVLGISVSTLQMYENGERMPRDDIKLKIADYFGLTVEEIFFNSEQHEMCG